MMKFINKRKGFIKTDAEATWGKPSILPVITDGMVMMGTARRIDPRANLGVVRPNHLCVWNPIAWKKSVPRNPNQRLRLGSIVLDRRRMGQKIF